MAHMQPLPIEQISDPEIRETIKGYEAIRGFIPNSIQTMVRRPNIVKAFMALNQAVLYEGTVANELKMLVSLVTSLTSGCLYCQSHMTNLSKIYNASEEKINAIANFEDSSLFDDDEKSALNLAFKASSIPNAVIQEDFDRLQLYFNEEQIVEIVSSISLFGFLNRWNDTMATEVEPLPATVTKKIFTEWDEGKHKS
jgi:uncharacterized peroxidase-related enzyme